MTPWDELWLRRALELARRAVPIEIKTNPPVGAVIAADDRLISEGYHRVWGGPHAEIEALQRVPSSGSLHEATLYVTLEPCCHTDKKTPPCVPRIVEAGIRRVVIGCKDPNPAVSGKGIQALRAAGVSVFLAPNPYPFRRLLRHFRVGIQEQRPYITLKWAQISRRGLLYESGYIGSRDKGRWPISGFWGLVWGHRLRARHSHIAVGYRTWQADQPTLTTRFFPGQSPQRIIFYDPRLGEPPERDEDFVPLQPSLLDTLRTLYASRQVGSLLVEGGGRLLERFLSASLYDEVHVLVRLTDEVPPSPLLAPAMPTLRWRRRVLAPQEIVWIGRP
ncbi:MAG: bifunctional diaminohydroxyphosphoribosylaminopyrimidine deaminase/5-amino-6-(5-phosphoribosylamino)uracil reductase RibD [Bacteroidia bacterium]|nr:bifunctional diaminohydroxyphosphoribosylaminopyrimidine deaminase/5-amino-6-(5-phosphoribosylamino)uracil reductase RibD [Bacteroidia bacterium]